jgi:hypothetical protein
MQRLASTDWIETFVKERMGPFTIELHKINPTNPSLKSMAPHLYDMASYIAGSSVLDFADVARAAALVNSQEGELKRPDTDKPLFPDADKQQLGQGVFVLDKGPFLRGICNVRDPVVFDRKPGMMTGIEMERNAGDSAAFALLDCEMRRRNMMDWTPDGICLSKLESPSGEPQNSAALDAQSAQLYNLAVKGPAITTAWTSDVRDAKLQCHPMDRVFICIVADVCWSTKAGPEVRDARTKSAEKRAEVLTALKFLKDNPTLKPAERKKAVDALTEAVGEANAEAKKMRDATFTNDMLPEYRKAQDALKAAQATLTAAKQEKADAESKSDVAAANTAETKRGDAETAIAGAQDELNTALGGWDKNDDMALINEAQNAILSGTKFVAQAYMTNFELMRTTSSHLCNYSAWDPNNAHSRCGLPLGKPTKQGSGAEYTGAGRYIVGGWCIGTVMDSAASRSTVGQLTRTTPTSMAMQVAVDVEWMSGDQLYAKYMDKANTTAQRGEQEWEYDGAGRQTNKRKEPDDADKPTDSVRAKVNIASSAQQPAPAASSAQIPRSGRRV